MRWFLDLKLRTKILAGFLLVLTLAALQGLTALLQMREIHGQTQQLTDHWLPAVQTVGELKSMVARYRSLRFQYLVVSTEADQRMVAGHLHELEQAVADEQARYARLAESDAARAAFERFNTNWRDTRDYQAQVLLMLAQHRVDDAKALLNGDARVAAEAMNQAIDQLAKLNDEGALAAREAGHRELTAATRWVWVGILATALASLAIAWWLSSLIARRVARARDAVSAVADGRLDERVHARGRDEVAELLHAVRRMQGTLATVVSNVRDSADSVATASTQIAHGNQDLSRRTESQASALQQTAASMVQLGSTVQQNAANAQQASRLAHEARDVARHGGEAVDRMVDTMKDITEASRRIADIIGTIDGIAFQTNILALNAAVEAARAGEQGRGFAVVATEVRQLAQRSADAAKEIKSLITASVERIEHGNALAERSGQTMGDVLSAIARVADIVGEISSASQAQSSGVSQVGQAVGQMDETTQRNAALVEESAAAAESLRRQARELVEAMAVFKLGQRLAA
jgi:methyl-accepting chemotaxis protein